MGRPGLLLLAATVALASPSPRREGGRAPAAPPRTARPGSRKLRSPPSQAPPEGREGGFTLEPLLWRIRAAVWRWLGLCRILLPRLRG